MTDPEPQLAVAYVIRAGRIEATINLSRQSVRFVVRDDRGLDAGTCEMFMGEWSAIGDAIISVAERLKKRTTTEPEEG